MHLGLCDVFSPVYPKFEWVERALQQLGHTTVRVRTEADISDANDCDLLLFSQNYPFPPTLVSPPKAIWVFDLIGHGIGDQLRDYTPWSEFDAVFCKNPQDIEHPHAYWLDQAAPDWPQAEYERKWDVILPGRMRQSRVKAVEAIRNAGIKIAIAGYGWKSVPASSGMGRVTMPASIPYLGNCLTDEAMQRLFGSAKVILGDDYVQLRGYWSDRRWLAAAAGTPYAEIGNDVRYVLNNWDALHKVTVKVANQNRYRHRVQELLEKVSSLDLVRC